MGRIANFAAVAPTVSEATQAVINLLNDVIAEFPSTKVIGMYCAPEMRAKSIRAPNGEIVQIVTAVLDMQTDEQLAELVEWSKINLNKAGVMAAVKS